MRLDDEQMMILDNEMRGDEMRRLDAEQMG
jgi:hypothetical protein